ncbi:bifunctional proline dehydrogenase/L-glutamate gamma-semialdehyde dehydrogenase PutA [Hohaiivirga grylli]
MPETGFPVFQAPYAPDDITFVRSLLADAEHAPENTSQGRQRVNALSEKLITAIRTQSSKIGGVEELLHEYSLSTREGLALMVLAEALLRVPDSYTADRLLEDKLGQGNFGDHEARSSTILMAASNWALGISSKIIQPGETPAGIMQSLVKRIGLPTVRTAARQAMKVMGNHFVFGQTIEEGLKRSQGPQERSFRFSFDMLGEGARTADDALRYFKSYSAAIEAIARHAGPSQPGIDMSRPGISVKLSGLHPHYTAMSEKRVLDEMIPGLVALAKQAKDHNLGFTIDAEEADRLEISLDIISRVASAPEIRGSEWAGFGLAIQAYQKRAGEVIDFIADLAHRLAMPMTIRLVKGAYWDTEIKRAQERGLRDYPVFTRKAVTDLHYLHCARKLLSLRPSIFPQFATHNAQTVASILEIAGDTKGFEFQRLHGMGDALYKSLKALKPDVACRTYAPVGPHRDLLAYLVRRILENGANTSFVATAADTNIPVAQLLKSPVEIIGKAENARHPKLPRPPFIYGTDRINSLGIELGCRASRETIHKQLNNSASVAYKAAPILDTTIADSTPVSVISPIDAKTIVGEVSNSTVQDVRAAVEVARKGFTGWSKTPVAKRADILKAASELMEERRACFFHLLQTEAGKTIDDAISEVREAVDFLRYYATQACELQGVPTLLPSPTGESNRLLIRPRGTFVAISPWNFPLAILIGQIAAALVTGNAVIAKPAEQTPLIAAEAVKLLHEAGVPVSALQLVTGDGAIGAALVAQPGIDGVVFTGSVEAARKINQSLAEKDGPIVPVIAETGGLNAMIVDATALPEQVCDDVISSAFRSAGQRCSALRILCLQEDIADKVLDLIIGAAKQLTVGDPRDFATDIGPIIDEEAKTRIEAYLAHDTAGSKLVYAGEAPKQGTYIAPHIIELKRVRDLKQEIFGPVLHVVRFKNDRLKDVINDIAQSGYGLTLGIHSRIDGFAEHISKQLAVGNIYINRNIIGAVVGTQPFGGSGLSGTGPKAGGPHYLSRFTIEQTITINTAAAGGNAALMALDESDD